MSTAAGLLLVRRAAADLVKSPQRRLRERFPRGQRGGSFKELLSFNLLPFQISRF
jgi:hypothetical protein